MSNYPVNQHRKRASKPKSRTGCARCKKRRIKCDESTPVCQRCQKVGLECPGYQIVRQVTFDILDNRERRSYYYFRDCTANELVGLYEDPFWSRSVLHIGYAYPAIQHGLSALGALHESLSRRDCTPSQRETMQVLSLRWYTTAISTVRKQYVKESSFKLLLVACIVFTYYEIIRLNYSTAISLVRTGIAMLEHIFEQHAEYYSRGALVGDAVMLDIYQTFLRLRIQLNMVVDPSCSTNFNITGILASQIPEHFKTFSQARLGLNLIYYSYHNAIFKAKSNEKSQEVEQLVRDAHKHLTAWQAKFNTLNNKTAASDKVRQARLLLQAHWYGVWLIMTTIAKDDEMLYDNYTEQFCAVLKIAEEFLAGIEPASSTTESCKLGVDLSIANILLFIALNCRVKSIRRQAISTLRQSDRGEWLWDGAVSAKIASRAVSIEEGQVPQDDDNVDELVPKEKRIKVLLYNGMERISNNQTPSSLRHQKSSDDLGAVLGGATHQKTQLLYRRMPWTKCTKIESCWVDLTENTTLAVPSKS